MRNGKKVLTGDVQSVLFWFGVLANVLKGKEVDRDNSDKALRILEYQIPIKGNPNHIKTAILRARVDERSNRAAIYCIGEELLKWHIETDSICKCCARAYRRGNLTLCTRFNWPQRDVQFCESYKFKNTSGQS